MLGMFGQVRIADRQCLRELFLRNEFPRSLDRLEFCEQRKSSAANLARSFRVVSYTTHTVNQTAERTRIVGAARGLLELSQLFAQFPLLGLSPCLLNRSGECLLTFQQAWFVRKARKAFVDFLQRG